MGPEHTSTLNTVNNLAILYKNQGKMAEAEAIFNGALGLKRRLLAVCAGSASNNDTLVLYLYKRLNFRILYIRARAH
jgi:hypothetical protein